MIQADAYDYKRLEVVENYNRLPSEGTWHINDEDEKSVQISNLKK